MSREIKDNFDVFFNTPDEECLGICVFCRKDKRPRQIYCFVTINESSISWIDSIGIPNSMFLPIEIDNPNKLRLCVCNVCDTEY